MKNIVFLKTHKASKIYKVTFSILSILKDFCNNRCMQEYVQGEVICFCESFLSRQSAVVNIGKRKKSQDEKLLLVHRVKKT